jgi:hypothetical protein
MPEMGYDYVICRPLSLLSLPGAVQIGEAYMQLTKCFVLCAMQDIQRIAVCFLPYVPPAQLHQTSLRTLKGI